MSDAFSRQTGLYHIRKLAKHKPVSEWAGKPCFSTVPIFRILSWVPARPSFHDGVWAGRIRWNKPSTLLPCFWLVFWYSNRGLCSLSLESRIMLDPNSVTPLSVSPAAFGSIWSTCSRAPLLVPQYAYFILPSSLFSSVPVSPTQARPGVFSVVLLPSLLGQLNSLSL